MAHDDLITSVWRDAGVRVIRADQLDSNTAQTPGMSRAAAINLARVGAQKLWAGTVRIEPDARTGAHHHGALESVIYVVSGRARIHAVRVAFRVAWPGWTNTGARSGGWTTPMAIATSCAAVRRLRIMRSRMRNL